MKEIYALLIIVFLLAGCRSTKKTTESSNIQSNQTEFNQSKDSELISKSDATQKDKVDNDILIEETNVTVTNKYYPPTKADSAKAKAENKPPVGALESTTTSTNTKKKVDKTKAASEKTKSDESNLKAKEDNSAKSKNSVVAKNATTEKKSVPIQWGWIFACAALGVSIFIYFSKSGPATIVKTFLSKIFGK